MSTTTNPAPATKKEARVAEKKRVSGGVIALACFAGWMWHAAETADPGITKRETTDIATSAGGGIAGAANGARTAAQDMGLSGLLQPPVTEATAQFGGVAPRSQ